MKSRLEDLMLLFARAVGHTYTEIVGVKNNPTAILIVANEAQKTNINLDKKQMISLLNVPDGLRGLKKPIVIDHFALSILVNEMAGQYLKELSTLKARVKVLEEALGKIATLYPQPQCMQGTEADIGEIAQQALKGAVR